jgi:hypothetical protein
MAANQVTTFVEKLIKQAKADPKKAGILSVLVVVMAVLWVRLVGGSGGPSHASANTVGFRADGNGAALADNLRGPVKTNTTFAALQEWQKKPTSPLLSRNLFVVNYDFFPQDGSKPAPLRVPQGDGFWDHVAKSLTARADQKKEREVLVENLRLQAAQLKVQSTVMGASPKALINGELVGVGGVVASFRVAKIEARKIVVEREGIKLELRLN